MNKVLGNFASVIDTLKNIYSQKNTPINKMEDDKLEIDIMRINLAIKYLKGARYELLSEQKRRKN